MSESDNLEQFRSICEKSSFRHRDQILLDINVREFSLSSRAETRVPARSMLDIYKTRLAIGEKKAPFTNHSRSILDDVREYIAGLESVGEDFIRPWSVSFDNDVSYFTVFEAVNAGKAVGCIYGIDRRKVTEEEWDELWGKNY